MSKRKGKTNIRLAIFDEINKVDRKVKRIKSKINNCAHYKKFANDTWSMLDIPEDNNDTSVKEYDSLMEIVKTLASKREALKNKLR